MIKTKPVISCITHKTDKQNSEIQQSRFAEKVRKIRVIRKSTGRINNASCEWYIGSLSMSNKNKKEQGVIRHISFETIVIKLIYDTLAAGLH